MPPTDETPAIETPVGGASAIENSVERPAAAGTGNVNSTATGHLKQGLYEACSGRGQEAGASDSVGERPTRTSQNIPA